MSGNFRIFWEYVVINPFTVGITSLRRYMILYTHVQIGLDFSAVSHYYMHIYL